MMAESPARAFTSPPTVLVMNWGLHLGPNATIRRHKE